MVKDMTLEFVINIARSSQLKNLGVADKYDDLVNLINLTLIDLHNRFDLNHGIVDIPLEQDKDTYYIPDYIDDNTEQE